MVHRIRPALGFQAETAVARIGAFAVIVEEVAHIKLHPRTAGVQCQLYSAVSGSDDRHIFPVTVIGIADDEIIIECPQDTNLDAICNQMGKVPEWITGLLLRADGYETQFYKKD